MVLSPSLAAVSNMSMKSRNDLFFLKAGHFPLWFNQSQMTSGKDCPSDWEQLMLSTPLERPGLKLEC